MAKLECVQAPWFGSKRAQPAALFTGAYVDIVSSREWFIFSATGRQLAGPFTDGFTADDTLATLKGEPCPTH